MSKTKETQFQESLKMLKEINKKLTKVIKSLEENQEAVEKFFSKKVVLTQTPLYKMKGTIEMFSKIVEKAKE